MPVYEYRCESCKKQFEYEHRMSEKRTECVECGGPLERLISRTSFAFKGGGWYKDLYASAKPGQAESMSGVSTGAGASGAASTDSGSSSSSSSADKPASAAPAAPSTGSSGGSGTSGGSGGAAS